MWLFPLRRLAAAGALLLPLANGCADAGTAPRVPAAADAQIAPAALAAYLDLQSVRIGTAAPVAPAVRVTDRRGAPLAGVTVGFRVMAGGGSVQQSTSTTDSHGTASPGLWTMGWQAGLNEVVALVEGVAPVRFRAHAFVSDFNITIRYLTDPNDGHRDAVSKAVRRWESIIVGDVVEHAVRSAAGTCFKTQPALDETVDDLIVFVELVPMDGVGGYVGEGGPCYLRAGSLLPLMGQLRLDVADLTYLESAGLLEDLILHELGHVLGVGTLWAAKNLLNGAGSDDPRVDGLNLLAAYRSIGGRDLAVPAENSGWATSRDVHWRESVFANELMTAYIDHGPNPLSALTVATLQDLGYSAMSSGAAVYSLGTSAPSPRRFQIHDRERLVQPRFTVDSRGRLDLIR